MRQGSARIVLVLLPLAVIALHFAGCSNNPTRIIDGGYGNPETELTYAPPEGDTTSFRVHFYWNGFDNDGEVVRFRLALDSDTLRPIAEWTSTTAKDTTIVLTVGPGTLTQGHVFWVSAEDNSGRFDPTPAKRYFSIRTLPPTSRIIRGPENGAGTSSAVTFEWTGSDPDGGVTGGPAAVDSFEYLLLRPGTSVEPGHPALPSLTNNSSYWVGLINQATGPSLQPPYDDWKWQGTSERSHRFTGLLPGYYVFAIRAVDAAGARDAFLASTRNVRYFSVASSPIGLSPPLLTITSDVLVSPVSAQSTTPTMLPYLSEIEILEGDIVSFAWTGSPGASGVPIAGYSVALDDTAATAWSAVNPSTIATTLPSDLSPGRHFLFVRAVDMAGGATVAILRISIVHPTFRDRQNPASVLFVDDFAPPPGDWFTATRGSPNFPRDDEEFAWWQRVILAPLSRDFGGQYSEWDAVERGNYSAGGRSFPTLDELSRHRVVIWYVDFNNTTSSPTALWRTLVEGGPSSLAAYVRGGGTLIVTGFQLAGQTSRYPSIPYNNFSRGMCATLEEGSFNWRLSYFTREFMGIDGALGSDEGLRSNGARDFVEARVTIEGSAAGFQTAAVDTGGAGSGAKWNPNAFPGPVNQSLAPGLPKIEGWRLASSFGCAPGGSYRSENPGAPIAVPIFTYHGVNQGVAQDGGASPREGLVVGIATQAHDRGDSGGDGGVYGGGGTPPADSRGFIGRMVFLGFPIYYAKDEQAYAVMRAAFAYVNASPTLPAGMP